MTTCRKPSFLPQFNHIKPYFTRNEIINMSLNMEINVENNIKEVDVKKLCKTISKNEMNYNMLLKHKTYMINKKSLGLIQFYTLQGSHLMNKYLRNLTLYKEKNSYLESLIEPTWNLILNAPEFDKKYTLYRFVQTDSYLNHLKIGDIFTESGFMSTTRNPFYKADSYQFGFILIKINIPKDVEGIALCLETISHFPEEQEIIFPPESKFKLISKNLDTVYYHTDINFSSKVDKRYEFDWISNSGNVIFKRDDKKGSNINEVNFNKLERKSNMSLFNKIKYFEENYVNKMDQFSIKLRDQNIILLTEKYDSTKAYEKFYAIKTTDGYSIYSIYDNYILFFIEIAEVDGEVQMHVNYYVKYNIIDPNKIVGDENLIMLYSSIAYYFDIHIVYIYANYMNCDTFFGSEQEIKSKIFGGNYCVDFYQYLVKKEKKYDHLNMLNVELYPAFSYYDLDMLKKISVNKILNKQDGELYQIYEKLYLKTNHNDNIADFYIWLKNTKCYLLDKYTQLIDRIMGKNNPFKYDYYILDPISFLYNRNYIKSYSSRFKLTKDRR